MTASVTLSEILSADLILADVESSGKKQLLEDLSSLAAEKMGLAGHAIFDVLWERESLGTTGVGGGIAIPHARVPGLETVKGLFARLGTPIAFESTDGQAVDLVFLLLSPEGAGADHLHALATVSRLLREATFVKDLRRAKDAKELTKLILNPPNLKAA